MGTTITLIGDIATVIITGDRPDIGPTYNRFDGWYGLPKVDMGFVKRPGAPGAFAPEQTFPDEALINIEGQHFAPSRPAGIEMRHLITSLYNDGRPITAVVQDDLLTTRREVMVEAVDVPWTIHEEFKYTIDMRAADPRRYGNAVTESTPLAQAGTGLQYPLVYPLSYGVAGVTGRVSITNEGTTETVSLFSVTDGSMPDGFEVVNVTTGQRLVYVGPVSNGDIIELDARTQTAFINGVTPAGRWLSNPEWWTVPAHSVLEVQFLARGAVTGTPKLTHVTAPAYY